MPLESTFSYTDDDRLRAGDERGRHGSRILAGRNILIRKELRQSMELRPVLYLDLDDTLVSWAEGHPTGAAGARDFVLWALPRFEIRWLTTWCPGGEMPAGLLTDLATMLGIPEPLLAGIKGLSWEGTESKLNAIAWLEHVVQGRPFVWLEDDKGFTDAERGVLQEAALLHAYVHCNVTKDPKSLLLAHGGLRRWFDSLAEAA